MATLLCPVSHRPILLHWKFHENKIVTFSMSEKKLFCGDVFLYHEWVKKSKNNSTIIWVKIIQFRNLMFIVIIFCFQFQTKNKEKNFFSWNCKSYKEFFLKKSCYIYLQVWEFLARPSWHRSFGGRLILNWCSVWCGVDRRPTNDDFRHPKVPWMNEKNTFLVR